MVTRVARERGRENGIVSSILSLDIVQSDEVVPSEDE